MLLTGSAGWDQILPPALHSGSLLTCNIWRAFFFQQKLSITLSRHHQDLGLVCLLSPLTRVTSGKSAHSWALPGSYLGKEVSTPGSLPLLAEISPRLIPNSLGVQGDQLFFGLIAIFFSKAAVTAVERHRFLKYPPPLESRVFNFLREPWNFCYSPRKQKQRCEEWMNELNTPHPLLKFVCAQSCHAWDSPASPSQAFGVSSDSSPSFCFLHLHTSAHVFRVVLRWE